MNEQEEFEFRFRFEQEQQKKAPKETRGLYRKSYEEEYLPKVRERQSRVSIPGAEAYDKAPAMSYEEYEQDKNRSLKEKALGPLDALATIGTSMTAGAGAALAAPVFTAAKNGKNVLQNYEDIYNKLTWTPKTGTGEDILMGLAPIVGAFPPVGGYLPALSRIRSGKKAPVPGPQMPPTPDFEAMVRGSVPETIKPAIEAPDLRLELPEVADRRVAEQNRKAVRGADDWNSMEHAARAVEEEAAAMEQMQKQAADEAMAAEQLRTHEFLRDAQQTVIDDHPYGDRPAQYGMTDTGGRLDENGMPIRADLSMEAQNLQNPLQRNLWGDELPGKTGDGGLPLTQALDKMPPGPERDMAMSQLRGQRGAIDLGNNASGESPASLEALGRLVEEGRLDRARAVIKQDGTVQPLIGVDAVDYRPRPGEVVAQKNIGNTPWTILDSNSVKNPQAQLNRGMSRGQQGGVDFEAMSKYLKDTLFSFGSSKDLQPGTPRVMSPEQVAQRTELRSKANATGLKGTPYNRIASLEEAVANPGKDIGGSYGRDELGSGVENIVRLHPDNNLAVYARTVVQDARNLTERAIKNFLTNDKDGVVVFWRKMSQEQKNNVIALWQALDKHQKPLTEDILNQSGFDSNQKAFLTKVMDANDGLYSIKAGELAAQGFEPHKYRRGYMPGIFTGAYRTLIGTRKADGSFSIQAVAQADTKLGHKKALEYYKQKLGDGVEYVTLPRQGMSTVAGHGRSTLNQGLSTLLLEIAKRDENFADIKKFVEQKVADDFSNMYNFQVHEKMKKGVEGAVGKRPWLDVSTNTNEFFKAYMDYMEEGFRYSYYQKPLNEISKVVNNPELQNTHPKTLTYLNKYVKHLAGVSLNSFGAAGNAAVDSVAKLLTVGTGKVNTIKHEATHWSSLHMMGGPNLGFFLMQLTQVVTGGAPEAVALRNTLGLDPAVVSGKLIPQSGHALVKLSMERMVGKPADVPAHLRAAYTWAHEVGMFTFNEAELAHQVNQGPIRKGVDKVMGAPIEYGEKMTRPTVFMMYANLFDAAGFKGEDGFSRAQAATDWAMGHYHPDERPMIYQSLGFIGHMAGALATYKHNFIGQHIARVKDGRNNPGALVLSGALGLGLYGLMGLPFSQEASDLAEYFTDKPVRDMLLDSPDDPNGWLDGMLSFSTDLDFQSRLSQSSLFPDTPLSALPHINNFITVLGKGFEVGKSGGQDMSAWEGLGKQLLPAGSRGFVEGPMQKNAKTGMNKFAQARTPEEQTIRKILGVKPMRETLEEKNTYARQKIELRRQDKLRDASTRFDRAILEKDKMGQAKAEQDYIRNGGDIRELVNSQRIQDMLTKSQMSDRQRKAGIPTQNINSINKYETYNP